MEINHYVPHSKLTQATVRNWLEANKLPNIFTKYCDGFKSGISPFKSSQF